MERIINSTDTKYKKERTKKGVVSIRNKKNGKEARVKLQLNIPGVTNPRLQKYGATEEIATKRLAEAILLMYIDLQKNKQFANLQVFSTECQMELNKFDEYMECLKQQQLKANGEKESSPQVDHPISLYVDKMIKAKKQQSELKGNRRKRRLSKKTVTNYWQTAKIQVLPHFR